MVSGDARPDLEALRELEEVLRHFETELASWRRRALSAESRLNEVAGGESGASQARLEEENRALAQRLQAARGHLGDLLDRLRFLEQQQGNGASGGGPVQ
jgi:predicted  nucleic acid-binding Zn-ribbon protein